MHIDISRIEVPDDETVAAMRALTGEQRVQRCFEMFQEHLREVIHSIRQAHPDWSATEVYIAVYAEMHGDDGRKAAVAIVKSDPRVPERFCRAHPS